MNEKKIELISSEDLHSFLDQKTLDNIYFDYMATLLPQKIEDITPQRMSAVILNGYVEIADRIATKNNISLEHGFDKDERGVRHGVRMVMYAMLFILLGLFGLAYFVKKDKNG